MSIHIKQLVINLTLILGTIILASVLVSSFIYSNDHIEPFTPLTPGGYPCTQQVLPLEGWYTAKKNPGLSNLSMDEQYKNYPVFSAGSTEINNKRFWETPDNGKCSPPGFCGNIYESKQIPSAVLFAAVPFGSGNRVNVVNADSIN